MNESLIEKLRCPECRYEELHVDIFYSEHCAISEGLLSCPNCFRQYPIINSIPRLLPDNLMHNCLHFHKEFFQKHATRFRSFHNKKSNFLNNITQKTLQSFSYQWTTFGEIYPEYIKHWQDFLPKSLKSNFFKGKTGLDVGCGFGRHLNAIASNTMYKELVGLDLSEAVESAFRNTKHFDNINIVQGSITKLPFKKGTFDYIYSIGVLHHLNDPEEGFRSLAELLKSGQHIYIWCYANTKTSKINIYQSLRKVTTKLPYPFLKYICLFAAMGIKVFLNWPSRALKKKLPWSWYNNFKFRILHADLFDLFSVPSTKYYSLEELEDWFRKTKLDIKERTFAVSGWTLLGEKNNILPD